MAAFILLEDGLGYEGYLLLKDLHFFLQSKYAAYCFYVYISEELSSLNHVISSLACGESFLRWTFEERIQIV